MLNAKIPLTENFLALILATGGHTVVAKKAEGDRWEAMRIIGQGMVWTESP